MGNTGIKDQEPVGNTPPVGGEEPSQRAWAQAARGPALRSLEGRVSSEAAAAGGRRPASGPREPPAVPWGLRGAAREGGPSSPPARKTSADRA